MSLTAGQSRRENGSLWAMALSAATAAACGSCSSDESTPPEPEACGLSEYKPTAALPSFEVEKIYNVSIRSPATDPENVAGLVAFFIDDTGVASFTRSSYVRATLDGELVSTTPYSGFGAIYDVKRANDVYAVTLRQDNPQADFCFFSQSGEVESCREAPGKHFAWHAPNFYFPTVDTDADTLDFIEVSSEGVIGERHSILPFEDNWPGAFVTATEAGYLLERPDRQRAEDPACDGTNIIVLNADQDVTGPGWQNPVPPGYRFSKGYAFASTEKTIASLRQGFSCRDTVEDCVHQSYRSSIEPISVLSLMDVTTGEQIRRHGEDYFADTITWDGKYFVLFKIIDGYGYLTFVDTKGEIVGQASWIEAFNVEFASGYGLAAVAPGDYIISFSIYALEPQDRLARMRVTLPE